MKVTCCILKYRGNFRQQEISLSNFIELRKYYNYLNNIDMALLRTSYMYGGVLEYYFRLQFSAFWSMHDKTSS